MKKLLVSLLLNVFLIASASATYNVANRNAWGDFWWKRDAWNFPDIKDVYILPIGATSCNDNDAHCGKKKPANALDEEIAIVYMARRLVPNGGYFCLTQLRSRNEGGSKVKKVWTQYQEVAGSNHCNWLCKEGFGGNGCTNAVSDIADSTNVSREALKKAAKYEESGGYDYNTVEIDIWNANGIMDRGGSKTDEQEVIVVATGFMDHGKGIVVRPVTFTAFCGHDYTVSTGGKCKGGNSGLKVIRNTQKGTPEDVTLCLNGHTGADCHPVKPNSEVDKAEPASDSDPDSENPDPKEVPPLNLPEEIKYCPNYSEASFSRGQHIHQTDKDNNNKECIKYRCADTSKGFRSEVDTTCVEKMYSNHRSGVCDSGRITGVMVNCPVGEVFSDTAPGCCAKAVVYTTADLVYGRGKPTSTPWNEQCWLISEPTEYAACIRGVLNECVKSGINSKDYTECVEKTLNPSSNLSG